MLYILYYLTGTPIQPKIFSHVMNMKKKKRKKLSLTPFGPFRKQQSVRVIARQPLPPPTSDKRELNLSFVSFEIHTVYTFLVPFPMTDLTTQPICSGSGTSIATQQHADFHQCPACLLKCTVRDMRAVNSCSEEESTWHFIAMGLAFHAQ